MLAIHCVETLLVCTCSEPGVFCVLWMILVKVIGIGVLNAIIDATVFTIHVNSCFLTVIPVMLLAPKGLADDVMLLFKL